MKRTIETKLQLGETFYLVQDGRIQKQKVYQIHANIFGNETDEVEISYVYIDDSDGHLGTRTKENSFCEVEEGKAFRAVEDLLVSLKECYIEDFGE